MFNLCHLATAGSIYCLLSNSRAARWLYVLFVLPHAVSPLPALLTPDRSGWTLPYYAELFFLMHGALLVLPFYLVMFRAWPIVQHMRSQGFSQFISWIASGAALALILWFGILTPLALLSTNNIFYMLCPPGNLAAKLAFIGKGWSSIGHFVLVLLGIIYSTTLCYVVAPITSRLFQPKQL